MRISKDGKLVGLAFILDQKQFFSVLNYSGCRRLLMQRQRQTCCCVPVTVDWGKKAEVDGRVSCCGSSGFWKQVMQGAELE